MSNAPSRPTKEQLSELPREAINLYAARCALRALPLLVHPRYKLDYWEESQQAGHLRTCLNAALIGVVSDAQNKKAAEVAAEAAETAAKLATNDIAHAAMSAAWVANTVAALDNTTSIDAAVKAVISASDAAISDSTTDVETIYAAVEDYEFLKLGRSKAVKTAPLWNGGSYFKKKIALWVKTLEFHQLSDYGRLYNNLLRGNEKSSEEAEHLFQRWWSEQDKIDDVQEDSDQASSSKVNNSQSDSNPEEPVLEILLHIATAQSEKPSAEDHLGRQHLVAALQQILTQADDSDPITIGLLGDWGAGKTSVLKQLETSLDNSESVEYTVQQFNAWSYEHTDDIQAGVAQEAVEGLTKGLGVVNKLKLAWKLNHTTNPVRFYFNSAAFIAWILLAGGVAVSGKVNLVLSLGVGFAFSCWTFYRLIRPLFASTFASELLTYLNLPNYSSALGQLPVYQEQIEQLARLRLNKNKRLLFVVDDLDRCSTEGIIKVFEAIRLVMELEHVAVIIAIDHRIALAALAHQYRHMADDSGELVGNKYQIARDYLGKIIHLPVRLHTPLRNEVNDYIDVLFEPYLLSDPQHDPEGSKVFDETGISKADKSSEPSVQAADKEPQGTLSMPVAEIEQQRPTELQPDENALPQEASIHHSTAEKELFAELCDVFAFTNPRQLKRMQNSYRLIRSIFKEHEDTNLRTMVALFAGEYEEESNKGYKASNERLRSYAGRSELIPWFVDPTEETSREVELINNRVQAFVLPSMRPSEKVLENNSAVD
ncbi:MAG: KAP family P-loop NTPase fold protein [Arenicella sp.]